MLKNGDGLLISVFNKPECDILVTLRWTGNTQPTLDGHQNMVKSHARHLMS